MVKRLTPEERAAVLKMTPEERGAFIFAKAEAESRAFAKQITEIMSEGRIFDLGFPGLYRIFHAKKTLVLQNPERVFLDENLKVLHQMVVKQFATIGWKVTDGTV